MNRISTGILSSSLFLLAACGSSSSGNSNGNAQCKTATPNTNFKNIVVPGSNSSQPGKTNNPAIPMDPDANKIPGADTAQPDNCNDTTTPTTPGNLGGTPTTGTPIATNPTMPGTNPSTGGNPTGGYRGPAADLTSLLGDWDFQAVYCENGTVTPVLQRLNELHMNEEFYVTLTISQNSMEEFRWVKLPNATAGAPMMCTIKQKSTFTSVGGPYFRVSTTGANYDDAGGEAKCNLGSEPSAVYEKVGLIAGGDALVKTIANASECNGMTMIQTFEKRRR